MPAPCGAGPWAPALSAVALLAVAFLAVAFLAVVFLVVVFFAVAFFLAVPLWIVMILEFLRERPLNYPRMWGFLLLTGPVFGPLLFYYFVWRKRYPTYAVA